MYCNIQGVLQTVFQPTDEGLVLCRLKNAKAVSGHGLCASCSLQQLHRRRQCCNLRYHHRQCCQHQRYCRHHCQCCRCIPSRQAQRLIGQTTNRFSLFIIWTARWRQLWRHSRHTASMYEQQATLRWLHAQLPASAGLPSKSCVKSVKSSRLRTLA